MATASGEGRFTRSGPTTICVVSCACAGVKCASTDNVVGKLFFNVRSAVISDGNMVNCDCPNSIAGCPRRAPVKTAYGTRSYVNISGTNSFRVAILLCSDGDMGRATAFSLAIRWGGTLYA